MIEAGDVDTIRKGAFGTGASILGAAITMTELEQMLRVFSVAVGLMIGIVTLWSMLRKKKGQ